MSSDKTDSQIIAAFAAGFDASVLDDEHVRQCGRALVDTMAVAIAAQYEPTVRRAHQYVESLAPNLFDGRGRSLPAGPAFGGADRLPPSRAPRCSTASPPMCSISTMPRRR
jgi:2-methylcitrate dehydratase PrpD